MVHEAGDREQVRWTFVECIDLRTETKSQDGGQGLTRA